MPTTNSKDAIPYKYPVYLFLPNVLTADVDLDKIKGFMTMARQHYPCDFVFANSRNVFLSQPDAIMNAAVELMDFGHTKFGCKFLHLLSKSTKKVVGSSLDNPSSGIYATSPTHYPATAGTAFGSGANRGTIAANLHWANDESAKWGYKIYAPNAGAASSGETRLYFDIQSVPTHSIGELTFDIKFTNPNVMAINTSKIRFYSKQPNKDGAYDYFVNYEHTHVKFSTGTYFDVGEEKYMQHYEIQFPTFAYSSGFNVILWYSIASNSVDYSGSLDYSNPDLPSASITGFNLGYSPKIDDTTEGLIYGDNRNILSCSFYLGPDDLNIFYMAYAHQGPDAFVQNFHTTNAMRTHDNTLEHLNQWFGTHPAMKGYWGDEDEMRVGGWDADLHTSLGEAYANVEAYKSRLMKTHGLDRQIWQFADLFAPHQSALEYLNAINPNLETGNYGGMLGTSDYFKESSGDTNAIVFTDWAPTGGQVIANHWENKQLKWSLGFPTLDKAQWIGQNENVYWQDRIDKAIVSPNFQGFVFFGWNDVATMTANFSNSIEVFDYIKQKTKRPRGIGGAGSSAASSATTATAVANSSTQISESRSINSDSIYIIREINTNKPLAYISSSNDWDALFEAMKKLGRKSNEGIMVDKLTKFNLHNELNTLEKLYKMANPKNKKAALILIEDFKQLTKNQGQ